MFHPLLLPPTKASYNLRSCIPQLKQTRKSYTVRTFIIYLLTCVLSCSTCLCHVCFNKLTYLYTLLTYLHLMGNQLHISWLDMQLAYDMIRVYKQCAT